jgi:Protein-tyrosine-phosphatase
MKSSNLGVAVICTANRFRSPLAEGFLRAAAQGFPVSVHSYATHPTEGETPLPEAIKLASRYGVDISEYRSRSLSRSRLERVDLVVGFECIHVAKAVVEAGAKRELAFTLLELIRALAAIELERDENSREHARLVIRRADQVRSRHPSMEIYDPVGGQKRGYTRVGEQVHELIAELVVYLLPATSP